MGAFNALERLPEQARLIVSHLLGHRALQRLGYIRQLGFSTRHQQTRLQHTLESLNLAIALLEKVSNVSSPVRNHLIAAITLEDIGRAPFSNSLDPIFTSFTESSGERPIDVQHSVAVIRHLERTENLLSIHGLWCPVVCELLEGRTPWQKAQWARSFISGPADIDRLQYVKADTEYVDGVSYDITGVARGIIFDGNDETIVDASSLHVLIDFLLRRTRLYMEVYYEPVKLALEFVVRHFLRSLWSFIRDSGGEWQQAREPRSVEDFLGWTDVTVLNIFDGHRWTAVPDKLQRLRLLILEGGLQVAELRERGAKTVDLQRINRMLNTVRDFLAKKEHCWIIDTDGVPPVQTYRPGTIAVLLKGRHRDLSQMQELSANPELMQSMRRCPLVAFPTQELSVVQGLIHEAGLVLTNLLPVDPLRRFAT